MRVAGAGVLLSAAAVVSAVSFVDGGYFPRDWPWITVALCSLGGLALLLRESVALGRLELVTVAALAALVGWTALSATWSSAPTESLHDAERGLIYVACLLAFLLLVDAGSVRWLLAGVGVGVTIVTTYALAQRLAATHGSALEGPIGYANGLALLAAFGVVVAVGMTAHARDRGERALWSAAPVLGFSTLALTQSRGVVLAFAAGLAVLVCLEPRRPELLAAVLVLALPCAASAASTLAEPALTDPRASPAEVTSSGRWLGGALALLVLVAGAGSLALDPLARRLGRRRLDRVTPALFVLVLAGVAAAASLGIDRALGPRGGYWRVAWHEFAAHPWLGSGAATFFRYWQRTGATVGALDAHNLYLETLAELGIVGLALAACVLLPPLLGSLPRRKHPFAALATAVYLTFLVHAGLDWDWELPAATIPGILGAVALLCARRAVRPPLELDVAGRCAAAAALVAIAVLAALARALVG